MSNAARRCSAISLENRAIGRASAYSLSASAINTWVGEEMRTIEFFDEIDDRAGYYVGTEIKWRDDSVVRALHYDNLGDPDDATAKEPAWRTSAARGS